MSEVTTILDVIEPWSVYLFGEPKCGKTTLAAYAPKPLFLMVDRNGHRALRRIEAFHSIPMVKITSTEQMEKTAQALKLNKQKFGDVQTVIVDTFSRLQQLSNRELLQGLSSARKDLSENEYRITNGKMERIMTLLQSSGLNTVFLAHEKEERDNKGTTILIRPANSEGTMGNLLAQTDGIFYMSARGQSNGQTERTLRTVASPVIKAGNRFENLPVEIKNPSDGFWKLLEVA